MDRHLLEIVLCPACEGALELQDATLATVRYADGEREEVESGTVACGCGQRYPVESFVLSFAALYPPELQREAAYWDRYYLWLLEQGSLGFHDLRLGLAPYITAGVPEAFPAADTIDRYDVHHQVAEHPLLRKGRTLLDIGVGLGWTTLYFARAGYRVTAFEPSLGPVTAAKRYAMQQGVFIEYICAAMGAILFRPDSFDNVTAFHSLHHVPDLEGALRQVQTWLKHGGALAIDEHTGNSPLARALAGEVHAWAESEVFPRYRTLPPDALASLPTDPHSALEDSSVEKVVPLVTGMFDVQLREPRHVFLDHYPLLYYLHKDRDLDAYRHALTIASQMQEFVCRVDPDGADYVTIVAENDRGRRSGVGDRASEVLDEQAEVLLTKADVELPSTSESIEFPTLDPRITELESVLARQGEWAREMERELKRKNAEVARLRNGRVMRVLGWLGGRSAKRKRVI